LENLESLLIVARGQKQLLAEVSSHPAVLSGDIVTLSRFITESVSQLLGLERVGVWLFNEEKDSLINIDLFVKSKGEHSHGAILQQHEFYEEFSYLKTEKYVDASDPYTDPRTKGFVKDYLKPNNITAMLDGVIRIGEELIGAICFEHVGVSHVWEEDEILFCSQLGDQISLAVSCLRKNKITDALREREIQLQELNESLESLVSERTMRLSQSNQELSKTISDLKQAQAKLILSEKMASLGQLVAGIAHEINNPIAAVLASSRNLRDILYSNTTSPIYTEWMNLLPNVDSVKRSIELANLALNKKNTLTGRDRMDRRKTIELWLVGNHQNSDIADDLVDLGIEIEDILSFEDLILGTNIDSFFNLLLKEISISKCLQIIDLAVERASKMTFALKNFSRYESNDEKIQFDLVDNLETVITIYQNQFKKDVVLNRKYDEIPQIFGYPEELLHLWTNLIYNGLQAMEFRGELTIEIIKLVDSVCVKITDSGKGIPLENRDRIFEPFFTTKPLGEGSGLGLDISKKIIDRHRGDLYFESVPGKTTFFVKLPLL